MTHVSIRFANEFDAERIGMIHIRSWQKAYAPYIPESILHNLSVSDRTQQWSGLIGQGVAVLVLELNEQVIGFASLCKFRNEDHYDAAGEVSAIYLDPNYWRNGYGTKLCLAALDELSHLGYQAAFLWVLCDNTPARMFYEKLGFQATNKTKLEEFYEGGALLSEVLYKKELTPLN